MNELILYLIAIISFIGLVISIEWDRIRSADPKKILIVLVILFFLGTALSPLF